MAYPFAKWPTLAAFIARACSDEFKAKTSMHEGVIGPRGPVTFVVLERDGKQAVLPDDDGHPLTPTMLRSLCKRSGIPVEAFGFTIGDWDDDADVQ